MKTYHIIPKATFDANYNSFAESHYIVLSSGDLLICVYDYKSNSHRDKFLALPGVISLPHPTFETAKLLNQNQVSALAVAGITPASTVVDVAKAAGAIHPGMRLF